MTARYVRVTGVRAWGASDGYKRQGMETP